MKLKMNKNKNLFEIKIKTIIPRKPVFKIKIKTLMFLQLKLLLKR